MRAPKFRVDLQRLLVGVRASSLLPVSSYSSPNCVHTSAIVPLDLQIPLVIVDGFALLAEPLTGNGQIVKRIEVLRINLQRLLVFLLRARQRTALDELVAALEELVGLGQRGLVLRGQRPRPAPRPSATSRRATATTNASIALFISSPLSSSACPRRPGRSWRSSCSETRFTNCSNRARPLSFCPTANWLSPRQYSALSLSLYSGQRSSSFSKLYAACAVFAAFAEGEPQREHRLVRVTVLVLLVVLDRRCAGAAPPDPRCPSSKYVSATFQFACTSAGFCIASRRASRNVNLLRLASLSFASNWSLSTNPATRDISLPCPSSNRIVGAPRTSSLRVSSASLRGIDAHAHEFLRARHDRFVRQHTFLEFPAVLRIAEKHVRENRVLQLPRLLLRLRQRPHPVDARPQLRQRLGRRLAHRIRRIRLLDLLQPRNRLGAAAILQRHHRRPSHHWSSHPSSTRAPVPNPHRASLTCNNPTTATCRRSGLDDVSISRNCFSTRGPPTCAKASAASARSSSFVLPSCLIRSST